MGDSDEEECNLFAPDDEEVPDEEERQDLLSCKVLNQIDKGIFYQILYCLIACFPQNTN